MTRDAHAAHCDQGEYVGSCKYGDADCPQLHDAHGHYTGKFIHHLKVKPLPERARIAQLEKAMRFIRDEAYRENGNWTHLKRVIAVQANAALDDGWLPPALKGSDQ